MRRLCVPTGNRTSVFQPILTELSRPPITSIVINLSNENENTIHCVLAKYFNKGKKLSQKIWLSIRDFVLTSSTVIGNCKEDVGMTFQCLETEVKVTL
jgi:hypothetical protein